MKEWNFIDAHDYAVASYRRAQRTLNRDYFEQFENYLFTKCANYAASSPELGWDLSPSPSNR